MPRTTTLALPRHEYRHPDGRGLWVYGPHGGHGLPAGDAPSDPPALHLRRDDLTGRWVAISPARNTRPQSRPSRDEVAPSCPLCPGGPELPFDYEGAVFENRFPTLTLDPPPAPSLEGSTAPSRGVCEVILYTSTHTGSLATLTHEELARVIAMWADRSRVLGEHPAIRQVLPFENRGEGVGATLSHPHGQIYAFDHLPPFTGPRIAALAAHRERHDRCLSCRVVARDDAAPQRRLLDNGSFVVAVPFAPDWPFEVHVRARRHGARRLTDLTSGERRDLAAALHEVVVRYDRLFDDPLPYLMTVLDAPLDDDDAPVDDWHLAVEFRPPNRAPDKVKVRASVETVAGLFINDTLPEDSARLLAEVDVGAPVSPDDFPDIEVAAAR